MSENAIIDALILSGHYSDNRKNCLLTSPTYPQHLAVFGIEDYGWKGVTPKISCECNDSIRLHSKK